MPEIKYIPIVTSTRTEENVIYVRSSYLEDILPNTLQALIVDSTDNLDNVSYIEGELVIQMKNNPEQINYYINDNGELILFTSTGDKNNYSIDVDGNLIWTGEQ